MQAKSLRLPKKGAMIQPVYKNDPFYSPYRLAEQEKYLEKSVEI